MTETQNGTRGTLLVVDGHSIAFRAFFALPVENFSSAGGQATNAIWGFLSMLGDVVAAERPDRLAIAFDVAGGTFRNELLGQYKGTREAAPEELLSQFPLIQQALTALGITYIEKPGYEGDDVIATLATMGEQAGYRTLVLSGDRDAFQLIDDDTTVLYPGYHFKDLKHMTPAAIEEKYHVTPSQYPDLAALRGEGADNIPGVPGVGDGFAAKWINEYGGLEGILEHAGDIKGKKGDALRENIEQVKLNRKVNALVRDIDLGVGIDQLTFGDIDAEAANALFSQLDFGTKSRQKFLAAFAGPQAPDAGGVEERSDPAVVDPAIDAVGDGAALETWAARFLPAPQSDEPSLAMDVAAQLKEQSNDCVAAVDASWTLYAQGSPKPGASSVSSVVLLAGAHAVVIDPHDASMKEALQRILSQRAASLAVHGYKDHLHMLASAGLDLPMPLFDTKLGGYLAEPDFQGASIQDYAKRFLNLDEEAARDEAQGTLELDGLDGADEPQSGVREAALVAAVARVLAPRLQERQQYALLKAIEMPVAKVLFRMECAGVAVDESRFSAMLESFTADAGQAERIAWDAAGKEVKLQSPKQLGIVLFEEMGLTPTKRTKKGSYTTNAAALLKLYETTEDNPKANEFLGAVLRFREVNKLKQIVESLIEAVNPHDGRIHTTFEQTVAATGRLSSVDPNLQNIPNRNAQGREIRSAFVAGEGYASLLSADYSQVELRLMADLSGDQALIDAFKSGTDFHKYVASLVYGVPAEQITGDQRSHVKAMSYGLAYGLSTYGLAQQLDITPKEADALKQQYFSVFGKVHDYLESLVSTARKRGYTETMFGRRRYFPALQSTNRVARDAAERAALNAPIQGSAADIMKIAMIRAQRALDAKRLQSRIVLQIHDELVVELAPGEEQEATALVKDAMENAVHLAVPLDVSTGIGPDWQLAAH